MNPISEHFKKNSKRFDPEGRGYDYETAIAAGMARPEGEHWQSRVAETGLQLKGRRHPTFARAVERDEKMGYKFRRGKDGRYYSYKPSDEP